MVLSYLREMNMASLLLRLCCAMLFGGLVGLERERKHRPAGLRTYMLVCLGAALTMLLSQYLNEMLTTRWAEIVETVGVRTDFSRFGAQAINGIGFLGAGTILVTGRQEVKGVTTAAGLWSCACAGLAIGAGFYECMLLGFLLIFLSIRVFPVIEDRLTAKARNLNIYIEMESVNDIGSILQLMKRLQIRVFDVDLDSGREKSWMRANVVLSLHLPSHMAHENVMTAIAQLSCVCTANEI
jgi:putative Mg2+ transporter-C (MgtC) family protein